MENQYQFKSQNIVIVLFVLLIIGINLLVYWPSFSHLFRHDEWFFFFSAKDLKPDWHFIINNIDWELKSPTDRLFFRPITFAITSTNRVFFGPNYIGPHILTFIKHLIVIFLLWLNMWRMKKNKISLFFVLLFSLLITGVDPPMSPLFDFYITTAIFLLLALYFFNLTIDGKFSLKVGFSIVGILIFLGMLTSELAFAAPFIFFGTYWFIFRKKNDANNKNKAGWLLLLIPLIFWGALYFIHLCFVYPFFNMTSQSNIISLWKIIPNIGRFLTLFLAGNFFPMFANAVFADKTYIYIALYYLIVPIFLIPFIIFIYKRKIINFENKRLILPFLLMFSVIAIINLGRFTYVDTALSNYWLPTSYLYLINALFILIIYGIIDFDKIKFKKLLYLILISLIFFNGIKVFSAGKDIGRQTQPLKEYFDAVSNFVSQHKNEPDFSFKMIDRPPHIKIFNWYSETSIDGLFNHFVNNGNPKYLLEYDYDSKNLNYSLYHKKGQIAINSEKPVINIPKADYVNSLGMPFTKVVMGQYHFLMGMFEVTQKQWTEVMGVNPSSFKDNNRPVENVSYGMAQEFIKRLNKLESTDSYRLPKLEEFLYLVNMAIPGIDDISKYAWLKDNSKGTTHSVGSLRPMPKGFYDIIGNVWEWTDEVIGNPAIKPYQDTPHIVFGGSWRDNYKDIDSLETNYPPNFFYEHLGLRLVREVR